MMTPQEKQQMDDLTTEVGSLTEQLSTMSDQLTGVLQYIEDRQEQQIVGPVDAASKASLGVITKVSDGSSAKTQTVSITLVPTSISVPAAYVGTLIMLADGGQYEVPYIKKV